MDHSLLCTCRRQLQQRGKLADAVPMDDSEQQARGILWPQCGESRAQDCALGALIIDGQRLGGAVEPDC
jgi:hypothetical protein